MLGGSRYHRGRPKLDAATLKFYRGRFEMSGANPVFRVIGETRPDETNALGIDRDCRPPHGAARHGRMMIGAFLLRRKHLPLPHVSPRWRARASR